MSVSAIFGTRMVAIPIPHGTIGEAVKLKTAPNFGPSGLMIECSSRPQKKATAHHKKTRPRKTQAWDIRRGPTVYPPLPKLPPEWTLVTEDGGGSGATDQSNVSASATATASLPLES